MISCRTLYGKENNMREDTRSGNIFYINIVLGVALIAILIIVLKPLFSVPKTDNSLKPQPKDFIVSPEKPLEPVYYISKVKAVSASDVTTRREFSDFKDMYENAPPYTVGGNMV